MIEVIQVNMNQKCLGLITMLNNIAKERLRRVKSSGLFPSIPGEVDKLSSYAITSVLQVSLALFFFVRACACMCAKAGVFIVLFFLTNAPPLALCRGFRQKTLAFLQPSFTPCKPSSAF